MLTELFSSQARISILKLFLLNVGSHFYQREIASITGLPIRAVQREVSKLERVGLISHLSKGKHRYYQVNQENPIFPELKAIFLKTVALGDFLRPKLEDVSQMIDIAFIYGSYASGEEGPVSDIDIFIVGNIGAKELAIVLSKAKEELGREINSYVVSKEELHNKASQKDHFVSTLIDEPKIFLAGDEDEFRKLISSWPSKRA